MAPVLCMHLNDRASAYAAEFIIQQMEVALKSGLLWSLEYFVRLYW